MGVSMGAIPSCAKGLDRLLSGYRPNLSALLGDPCRTYKSIPKKINRRQHFFNH